MIDAIFVASNDIFGVLIKLRPNFGPSIVEFLLFYDPFNSQVQFSTLGCDDLRETTQLAQPAEPCPKPV